MVKIKVGDTVRIKKSTKNWAKSMCDYIGKEVTVTETNGNRIRFENCGEWDWNFNEGHFDLVDNSNKEMNIEIW